MKKSEIQRFDALIKQAEEANSKCGYRRFYAIRSREESSLVLGIYDYGKKRYAISDPLTDNLSDICDEIEDMIVV